MHSEGQDSLRETWHTYYTGAKGLLYVIDSTDVDRMPLAKKELHKMASVTTPQSTCPAARKKLVAREHARAGGVGQ